MLKKISLPLLDIEPKLAKNSNPYYQLSLTNLPAHYFYAFSDLPEEILTRLKATPEKLVNRLVSITYEDLPSKDKVFSRYKVKEIKFS